MPRLSSAATQVVIGESGKPPALSPRCHGLLGCEAEHEPQRRHRAPERLHARRAPVERRGAEDEPGDELRVVAGEDRGDRAAHAVADRQHRLDLELREQRGGVVGAGLERERLGGADAAPVAAVVDRQDAVAGLLERAVGRVPVEVGREHPAVQEQDGRAVAAAVAQEHLAAPGHVDDAAAGQRDRRFGGPVRHRRQPSYRGGPWPHPTRSREPGWTGSRRGGGIRTGWRRRRRILSSRAVVAGPDGVLVDGDALALVPLDGLGEPLLLGVQDGRALFAVDGEGRDDLVSVRAIAPALAQDEGGLLAYAAALLNWHRRHRFCSVCGTASQVREAGLLRVCPACGAEHHPRTDPVVIMLVVDGERDRVLLGRQAVVAGGPLLRAGGVRRAGRVTGGRGRARGVRGVGSGSGGRALCLLAAVAVPELADAGVRGLVRAAARRSRRTASSRTRAGSRGPS